MNTFSIYLFIQKLDRYESNLVKLIIEILKNIDPYGICFCGKVFSKGFNPCCIEKVPRYKCLECKNFNVDSICISRLENNTIDIDKYKDIALENNYHLSINSESYNVNWYPFIQDIENDNYKRNYRASHKAYCDYCLYLRCEKCLRLATNDKYKWCFYCSFCDHYTDRRVETFFNFA